MRNHGTESVFIYMHVADFKIQFWTNIMPYSGSASPYFMQSKKPLKSCATYNILFKMCMWILLF